MLEKIKNILYGLFAAMWVTMVCSFMAMERDIGGAECNIWIVIVLWGIFTYLIIKKYRVIACVLSTVSILGLRIKKFGVGDWSEVSDFLYRIVFYGVIVFIFYKIFFESGTEKSAKRQMQKHANEKSSSWKTQYRKSYKDGYSYDDINTQGAEKRYFEEEYKKDYGYDRNEKRRQGPKLENGSDEYWSYRNAAEGIYYDFGEARTTDERRYHKKRGEHLKIMLLSEYGYNDECVKSICERFLDLRV